jgi:hypothetical protein
MFFREELSWKKRKGFIFYNKKRVWLSSFKKNVVNFDAFETISADYHRKRWRKEINFHHPLLIFVNTFISLKAFTCDNFSPLMFFLASTCFSSHRPSTLETWKSVKSLINQDFMNLLFIRATHCHVIHTSINFHANKFITQSLFSLTLSLSLLYKTLYRMKWSEMNKLFHWTIHGC